VLAKFVDYYIANAEALNYFQNSEFEAEFLLDAELKPYERKDETDYGYFIRGFVDRLDVLDDRINIIDYKSKKIGSKSGKHAKTQEKIDTLEDVQLALYMLYAKQHHPDKSLYAALLSFKGKSAAAFFGELTDEAFDEEYESRLKEIVFDTKAQIESGNFGFDNSDEEVCGWCDYKRICHQDVLEKAR
jgi:ATP-dependent helicase/DNAse subunit B